MIDLNRIKKSVERKNQPDLTDPENFDDFLQSCQQEDKLAQAQATYSKVKTQLTQKFIREKKLGLSPQDQKKTISSLLSIKKSFEDFAVKNNLSIPEAQPKKTVDASKSITQKNTDSTALITFDSIFDDRLPIELEKEQREELIQVVFEFLRVNNIEYDRLDPSESKEKIQIILEIMAESIKDHIGRDVLAQTDKVEIDDIRNFFYDSLTHRESMLKDLEKSMKSLSFAIAPHGLSPLPFDFSHVEKNNQLCSECALETKKVLEILNYEPKIVLDKSLWQRLYFKPDLRKEQELRDLISTRLKLLKKMYSGLTNYHYQNKLRLPYNITQTTEKAILVRTCLYSYFNNRSLNPIIHPLDMLNPQPYTDEKAENLINALGLTNLKNNEKSALISYIRDLYGQMQDICSQNKERVVRVLKSDPKLKIEDFNILFRSRLGRYCNVEVPKQAMTKKKLELLLSKGDLFLYENIAYPSKPYLRNLKQFALLKLPSKEADRLNKSMSLKESEKTTFDKGRDEWDKYESGLAQNRKEVRNIKSQISKASEERRRLSDGRFSFSDAQFREILRMKMGNDKQAVKYLNLLNKRWSTQQRNIEYKKYENLLFPKKISPELARKKIIDKREFLLKTLTDINKEKAHIESDLTAYEKLAQQIQFYHGEYKKYDNLRLSLKKPSLWSKSKLDKTYLELLKTDDKNNYIVYTEGKSKTFSRVKSLVRDKLIELEQILVSIQKDYKRIDKYWTVQKSLAKYNRRMRSVLTKQETLLQNIEIFDKKWSQLNFERDVNKISIEEYREFWKETRDFHLLSIDTREKTYKFAEILSAIPKDKLEKEYPVMADQIAREADQFIAWQKNYYKLTSGPDDQKKHIRVSSKTQIKKYLGLWNKKSKLFEYLNSPNSPALSKEKNHSPTISINNYIGHIRDIFLIIRDRRDHAKLEQKIGARQLELKHKAKLLYQNDRLSELDRSLQELNRQLEMVNKEEIRQGFKDRLITKLIELDVVINVDDIKNNY